MPSGRVKGGKHAARHRGQTSFERRLDASIDLVDGLPRLGGRTLAAVAVTGVLATSAVGGQAVLNGADTSSAATSVDLLPDLPAADVVVADDAESGSDGSALPTYDEPAGRHRADVAEAGAVSRSAERPSLEQLKQRSEQRAAVASGGSASASAMIEVEASDPRDIARSMLADYGWDDSEFTCLDDLWIGESNWDPLAENPSSGAYGIPQSLPADKMATEGDDWRTNPETQIRWGLTYIEAAYGTPCAADEFKVANNWY